MDEMIVKLKEAGYQVAKNPVPNGHFLVVYLPTRNLTSQEVLDVTGPVQTIFQGGHGSVVVFCESEWWLKGETHNR